MLTTFLLTSALATGQAAAPPKAMPAPAVTIPAAPATAPAPSALPPVEGINGAAAPAASCATCEAKPEEAPKPEVKYCLEKALANTAFGALLADRGIKVYGWTEMSYTGSTARRSNLPVTFNDQADAFQMNQNWLEVVKAVDTSKKEVQFGFKSSTILPGTDYRFTLARGLANDQLNENGNLRQYGFDPVYAYGELFLPNLLGEGTTMRFGRWGTAVGYEVIDAVNTPFLTKSYNFQYNPFTHTGLQATTQLNETWSMYNGLVTGSDVWFDPAATLTYVGGLKWAPKDGKTTAAVNVVVNNHRFNAPENFAHFNCYNFLLTHKVTDKLTYVLDATYSHNRDNPGVGDAHWYGFANYFLYTVNDKIASNLRLEVFDDSDGVRTGTAGTYFETTYGITWSPKEWLLVRPFARYDHNNNRPFEGDKTLYTGGIDLIVRW